jgi:hypothetical protein
MAETQKEAEAILGDAELGHSRSGDQAAAAAAEQKKETKPAKPQLQKTKTMAETTSEAKEIVGSKKRGKTRQETATTPKLKKTKTMAETAKV